MGISIARLKLIKHFLIPAIFMIGIFFPSFFANAVDIDNFEATIVVNADASVGVSEKIVYDFGSASRHGIIRAIPLFQGSGLSEKTRKIGITEISVTDENGAPYKFEELDEAGFKKIKIGDDSLFVTGVKTYLLNYKATGAIRGFNGFDEFFWDSTGHEWSVPINRVFTKIILPKKIAANSLGMGCFAGRIGETKDCGHSFLYEADGVADTVDFRHVLLFPGEGVSVLLRLPEAVVTGAVRESAFETNFERIKNYIVIFLPLIYLAVMFYFWRSGVFGSLLARLAFAAVGIITIIAGFSLMNQLGLRGVISFSSSGIIAIIFASLRSKNLPD